MSLEVQYTYGIATRIFTSSGENPTFVIPSIAIYKTPTTSSLLELVEILVPFPYRVAYDAIAEMKSYYTNYSEVKSESCVLTKDELPYNVGMRILLDFNLNGNSWTREFYACITDKSYKLETMYDVYKDLMVLPMEYTEI